MFNKAFEQLNSNKEKERDFKTSFFPEIDNDKYKFLVYKFLKKEQASKLENVSERVSSMLEINKINELDIEDDLVDKSFISFKQSMKFVELSQKENIKKNESFFGDQLKIELANKIPEDLNLKIYSAIGKNHLQKDFGVDFFVKVFNKDSNKELACCSIHLCNIDNLNAEARADVLLDIDKDDVLKYLKENSKQEFFSEKINEFTNIISFSLEEKMNGEILIAS